MDWREFVRQRRVSFSSVSLWPLFSKSLDTQQRCRYTDKHGGGLKRRVDKRPAAVLPRREAGQIGGMNVSDATKQERAEELVAKVVRMAGLVEYQDHAIVSRTIIDRAAGTVTVFAFAEGQGLSEHTAPYDAMVCVLEGDGEFTVSGETMTVGAGEMLVMPAHKPHAVRALRRFKMLLVMIKD
jgi:quercetin dioxygenase-like cupin family protein